jgi:hypothetical protein
MGRLSYDLQPRGYYQVEVRRPETSHARKGIARHDPSDLPVAGTSVRAGAMGAACVGAMACDRGPPSRTEGSILRDMGQESAIAGSDLEETLDLAARSEAAANAGRMDLSDLRNAAHRSAPGPSVDWARSRTWCCRFSPTSPPNRTRPGR